jgi:hypothetical protein
MKITIEFIDCRNDWIKNEKDSVIRDSQFYKNLEIERKKLAEEFADEPVYQLEYCDSLMFNSKYQEALDITIPLYRKFYSEGLGVANIIKCLTALGKDYQEFDWIVPPVVLKLDSSLLDLCKTILMEEVRFHESELFQTLLVEHSDYIMFEPKELAKYLSQYGDLFIVDYEQFKDDPVISLSPEP